MSNNIDSLLISARLDSAKSSNTSFVQKTMESVRQERIVTIKDKDRRSVVDRFKSHYKISPILTVFALVVGASLLTAATVFAISFLRTDVANFKSSISASKPIKQHVLNVDGTGELTATLTDKTGNDEDKVRYNLAMLNEAGDTLERVVSSKPGGKVKIAQAVSPGLYTFIVSSEDPLSEQGATYRLKILSPSDIEGLEDTTAPSITIDSPDLGVGIEGIFDVAGEASDETELDQVAVRLSGGTWVASENTNPWSVMIDSTKFVNGQYIIEVRATDTSGNSTVDEVLVNFVNDSLNPDPDPDPNPSPDPDPDPDPNTSPDPDPDPSPDPDPGPVDPPENPVGVQFMEQFTGNTGLDRFRTGIYHRDNVLVSQSSWSGDHNTDCGPPSTQRTISRSSTTDWRYLCKDHLMTAIGDTSGYSVGWFSPDQEFQDVSEVCWSVNLTSLGSRQWWKVAVLSTSAPDIMSEVETSDLTGIVGSDRAVASWGGVGGYVGKLRIGESRLDWYGFDSGADKMTRYPACFRDNNNGSVTFTITGPKDGGAVETESFTRPGSFPNGPLKVVFQDHNYTPTKSDNGVGAPIGFTWHWDNITIK